jgi:Tripartite tricarboxylate transporter family receptor
VRIAPIASFSGALWPTNPHRPRPENPDYARASSRLRAQLSARSSGQQFIIENRPAGANISAETVVKASPDAYTLLMVSVANTVNATHYDKLDFNSGKINMAWWLFVVRPSVSGYASVRSKARTLEVAALQPLPPRSRHARRAAIAALSRVGPRIGE